MEKRIKDMSPGERHAFFNTIGKRGREARTSALQIAAQARGTSALCADPYGHEALFKAYRAKRLHNPTAAERQLGEVLAQAGLRYEREFRLGSSLYSINFHIAKYNLGIEIIVEQRASSFKRKDSLARKATMCAALEIDLIVIHQAELENLPALIRRLEEATFGARAERAAA